MNSIRCETCGTEMNWPAKKCPHCGATLKYSRNLTPCRVCGEFVAKSAKKCPYCGVHTPNKNNFVAAILAIIIFGVWLFVILLSVDSSESFDNAKQAATSQQSTPVVSEAPTPEYIEVTAEQLWTAYEGNQVNADLLYGDKLLSVTGVITDIGKDILTDAPCVSLDSGNSYGLYPIQCFFPKNGEQTEQLAILSDGDIVTIYGTCTGEFITTIQLSECYLADRPE